MTIIITIATFFLVTTLVLSQSPSPSPIPKYVELPAMPTRPTPPSPGQPSSYSIDKIRNKRDAADSPSVIKSPAFSSEEDMADKKVDPKPTQAGSEKTKDFTKNPNATSTTSQPQSKPEHQLDMPRGVQPPVTYKFQLSNDTKHPNSRTDAEKAVPVVETEVRHGKIEN